MIKRKTKLDFKFLLGTNGIFKNLNIYFAKKSS